ncbi:MAG: hypothetical protein Sapg2KO_24680 [Saprospiraceae bacterium]
MNLDKVLLHFSKNGDDWTIRDAVRGTQIFGGIGSGKSSGSGKTIAKVFLKSGFGGLVLCAKPDEKDNWVRFCKETGRLDDLLIFEEGGAFEFNPLQYELNRSGKGAGEVFNLSNLFMEIYKMGNRFSGGGSSGEKDRYWDNALKRALNRMILLLKIAGKELSIENMIQIMSSVPTGQMTNDFANYDDNDWKSLYNSNFCIECILDAGAVLEGKREEYDALEEDHPTIEFISEELSVLEASYGTVYRYFMNEFARADEKTRSIVTESFLGLAEPFTMGILKKYFSSGVNLLPEQTHSGKIIILNFSVKEYLDAGVYAQGIYKYLWQQATERRDISQFPLPVFLWVDEAQLFLSDYDQIFQTTARSSRACTVFISQNISNYYVSIGGNNAEHKADSLLGNLGTKIFHSNTDSNTNEWASKLIGSDFISMISTSENRKRMAFFAENVGKNKSHQLLPQVLPREFTTLKSGGEKEDLIVEGVIQITGKNWSNGSNFQIIEFSQKY